MKQKQPKEVQPNEVVEQPQSDNWESCYRIAEQFYVQGDYEKAYSWYERASALPNCNPIVFFDLGYLFQHGEGVDSDSIEALKWYEKAASLGVPQAKYNLAYFYQNGIVVDKDILKAAQLLKEATSLMDQLQLERDTYDARIAECDVRLAEAKSLVKEKQVQCEDLELRNRELDVNLSAAKRECQWLEQEASRCKSALQELEKQYEERLHASDQLIAKLTKEHNESFEHMQSSYITQIDRFQHIYETNFSEFQKEKEQLSGRNVDLSRTLGMRVSELSTLQDTLQQLQMQIECEKKKKRIAFILAGIFGGLILILFI